MRIFLSCIVDFGGFDIKATSVIDCEQSLFSSKIHGEEHKTRKRANTGLLIMARHQTISGTKFGLGGHFDWSRT